MDKKQQVEYLKGKLNEFVKPVLGEDFEKVSEVLEQGSYFRVNAGAEYSAYFRFDGDKLYCRRPFHDETDIVIWGLLATEMSESLKRGIEIKYFK